MSEEIGEQRELKILFTGGSGMLGTEMKKHFPDASFPTREQLDVSLSSGPFSLYQFQDIDLVVHMAAYTDCVAIERNKDDSLEAIQANIIGTANVVTYCAKHKIKLVYISTDYVYRGDEGFYDEESAMHPINKYGWSKLGGECSVQMYPRSLIIRTSMGPDVFPYDKAFIDQQTSRVKVSDFANELHNLIISEELFGVLNVGNSRKSVYDFAKSTSEKPIAPCSRKDIEGYPIPANTAFSEEGRWFQLKRDKK